MKFYQPEAQARKNTCSLRFFKLRICRTEGAATNQPRAERSAALGYEYALRPSPEKAQPRGANVSPFQGLVAARCPIPGRRFALPWADYAQVQKFTSVERIPEIIGRKDRK